MGSELIYKYNTIINVKLYTTKQYKKELSEIVQDQLQRVNIIDIADMDISEYGFKKCSLIEVADKKINKIEKTNKDEINKINEEIGIVYEEIDEEIDETGEVNGETEEIENLIDE
ncbi:13355_t:CDS:2, partial [Dentiscutata heterogama]